MCSVAFNNSRKLVLEYDHARTLFTVRIIETIFIILVYIHSLKKSQAGYAHARVIFYSMFVTPVRSYDGHVHSLPPSFSNPRNILDFRVALIRRVYRYKRKGVHKCGAIKGIHFPCLCGYWLGNLFLVGHLAAGGNGISKKFRPPICSATRQSLGYRSREIDSRFIRVDESHLPASAIHAKSNLQPNRRACVFNGTQLFFHRSETFLYRSETVEEPSCQGRSHERGWLERVHPRLCGVSSCDPEIRDDGIARAVPLHL